MEKQIDRSPRGQTLRRVARTEGFLAHMEEILLFHQRRQGLRDDRLCLGHGSAWPAVRPVRGQPVQRAGELAVLYACRLAAGSARLEPVRQSAGGEWRQAYL